MLSQNLIVLKKHYPELYERIINIEDTDNLQEVKSKNGMINIVYNDEFWLHSRYNPESEAEKWVDNITIKDEDSLMISGLGFGYYLDKLINKFKNKKIMIVEPNIFIFKKTLEHMDMTKYLKSENLVFMVDISTYMIRTIICEYIEENKIKKIHTEEMPIYRKIYNEYLDDLYKEINRGLIQLRGNIATEMAFSQMWLNNTIRLLDYLKEIPNGKVLKEEFKDVPVVIVSAGPSLNKNAEYLKEIYDKALIIAVGSSVNILEKKGIIPHIIMGVDGQEAEAKLFENLKNIEPVFIFAPSIHYKAVEYYKGLKMSLFLKNDTTILKFYENLGVKIDWLDCGPSVSNIALVLANYLNASKIMLIGQDLSYTGNKRYADGGVHNHDITDDKMLKEKGFVKSTDIYDQEVYTRNELLSIKYWFEEYLKIYKDELEVYNCSEAGLGIEGTVNMKFKDAIDRFCVNKIDIRNKLIELARRENDINKNDFQEQILKYREETEELLKLSKKRIEKTYKMLEQYNEKSFTKDLKAVLNLCDKIEKFESFQVFVDTTGRHYIDSITTSTNNKLDILDNIKDKNKTILNGLILQYEYVHKSLEIMKRAFNKEDVEYTS